MNLKKLNKIILLIVLFVMIGAMSVNASVERVLDFTFDGETYANAYSDLKAAYGTDASKLKEHFANWGVSEGRVASPVFDVKFYVNYYADLKAAYGTNYEAAYNHFLNYGMAEGRLTSPVFDVRYYVENYADLKAAYGTDYAKAFNHFVNYGMTEGRKTAANFDVRAYIENYADLKAAYGTDYEKAFNHYLNYGMAEGRIAVAMNTPVKPDEPVNPEHKHSYVPTFDFAEDNKTCKITLTCSEDASHKVEEVVNTTAEVEVEATCGTEGKVVYTASKEVDGVKYTKSKEVTQKVEHDFSKESVKKAATCNAEGIVYHTCSRCGAFEKDANSAVIEYKVPKRDHEWQKDEDGNDVIVDVREEPTCTEDAYIMRHCKLCGKDVSESTAAKTGHDYKLQAEPDAYWGRFTPGKVLRVNLVCAKNRAEVVRNLEAKVEKVSSTPATCTEDGVDVYTAKVEYTEDGKTYVVSLGEHEVTLPKTGHAQAPTEVTLPNGDKEVTTICPDCGINETTITHTGYDPTTAPDRVVKEATCSEEGIGEWICTNCKQTVQGPIAKTQHSLVEEPAVAANCKEDTDGNIQYWRCTVCNGIFKDAAATEEISFAETIVPAEHTLRHVTAKDKTCTTDGRIEYWSCTNPNCKRIFRDAEATDECTVADTKIKASHNIQYVPATVATCEEAGNKEHYKCTADGCGKLFLDEQGKVETTAATVTIAQLAHDYEEHEAIAAICTEDGMKKHFTCKTCSNYFAAKNGKAVKPETLVVKALGAPHSLTHVLAKDATCTTNGNIEYWTCSKCSTTFTAERATQADVIATADTVIPAGHKFVIVGTKAACEYANVYCSACKDHGTAARPVSAEDLIPANVDKTDRTALETAAKAVFGDDYANYIPARNHDIFEIERTEKGVTYVIEHCNICNKDISKTAKN